RSVTQIARWLVQVDSWTNEIKVMQGDHDRCSEAMRDVNKAGRQTHEVIDVHDFGRCFDHRHSEGLFQSLVILQKMLEAEGSCDQPVQQSAVSQSLSQELQALLSGL